MNRTESYFTIKSRSLRDCKGIGPKTEYAFNQSGIKNAYDLLNFFPRTYLDYSKETALSDFIQGKNCVCRLRILTDAKTIYIKGLSLTTCTATDDKEKVKLSWFNQPYRASTVNKDMVSYVYGTADVRHGKCIMNPSFSDTLPGIIPVYPRIDSIKGSTVRNAISELLKDSNFDIPDLLPDSIRKENNLIPLHRAYKLLHMPEEMKDVATARNRIDFDNTLSYFLNVEMQRQERHRQNGFVFSDIVSSKEFQDMLPFHLTNAQLRVIKEIRSDMTSKIPMNRMVQGDVGSGKTAVAMYAMCLAQKNGKQTALLAPTEVLARQHYRTVSKILPNTMLLTGGLSNTVRKTCLDKIENGLVNIVIGTHALLQSDVKFQNLSLVITDEQHRFGVSQRFNIEQKGLRPDVLVMSATPIPRTLALLLYGDLDLSCIDCLPFGRKEIKTSYIPQKRRLEMYDYIFEQAKAGKQTYIVCPYIEDEEGLEVQNVQSVYRELKNRYRDISIAMLHGKMKQTEKDQIMDNFREGNIRILVTTTVIEVGVDVKDAVYMVIEDADRFGLAQLHQLRGRVGRGTEQSYCFLLSNSESDSAKLRIQTICSISDGYKISEMDMKMRGAGDFIGTRQHGEVQDGFLELGMDEQKINAIKKAALEIIEYPSVQNTAYLNIAIDRYKVLHDKIAMN